MNLDYLGAWLQSNGLTDFAYRSTAEIFIVVVLTAMVSFASKRFFVHIEKQFAKTQNLWDDNLLHAARAPVSLGIWIIGLSLAAYTAQNYAQSDIFGFISSVQRIGVIICLTWFIVRFISGAEKLTEASLLKLFKIGEADMSVINYFTKKDLFNENELAKGIDLMTQSYFDSGYLDFAITNVSTSLDDSKSLISLEIEINECSGLCFKALPKRLSIALVTSSTLP